MPITDAAYAKITPEEKYLLLDGVHQALMKKFHPNLMEAASKGVEDAEKAGRDLTDLVIILTCVEDMEESARAKYTTDYVASWQYRQEFYDNGPWKDRKHPYHDLMLSITEHPGDMTLWGVVIAGMALTVRKIHFGDDVVINMPPAR